MNSLLLGVSTWPPHTYAGAPSLGSCLLFLVFLLGLCALVGYLFGRYL